MTTAGIPVDELVPPPEQLVTILFLFMCTSVKNFAKWGPGKHPTALNTYLLL